MYFLCSLVCLSGYQEALAKFTLKKFLLLVLFLDKAKTAHLIGYNPCLFCKDSDYKVCNTFPILTCFFQRFSVGWASVCRSCSFMRLRCQTRLNDRGPALGGDSWGPKEHCVWSKVSLWPLVRLLKISLVLHNFILPSVL